jgi:CheY-like chemotaxis protein
MTLESNCLHHQKKKQKPQQKEQHKAILAIDDETDIIIVIKKSSQIIGFSIDGFTDPLLALEQYRTNNNEYFLIISDLAMPSMNGFEFIRKIRLTSADIKVVLMTASNISDSGLFRELASSLKIDCIIQKPISLRELIDIIQKQKLLHVTVASTK